MPRRKGTNTGIPGLSFSWRRALGISQAQSKLSRSGRQRKFGAATGCLMPILILSILFILTCSVFAQKCFASEREDYQTWYDKAQEIQYRLEVGIAYKDYEKLYSDLYVDYRKLQDKNTNNALSQIANKILRPYEGYKQVWSYQLSVGTMPKGNDSASEIMREMADSIPGHKYQDYLQKNDPEYYSELDPQIKALDPYVKQYPNRNWLGKNVQKVLLQDAQKHLLELKSKLEEPNDALY